MATNSLAGWWRGDGFRLYFAQGGSTLTQQMVRGYFLRERWSRENGRALFHDTPTSRLLALVVGVPTTNKLLRKVEEVRLALWLEEEMSRRFGSRAQAKREIFARAASFKTEIAGVRHAIEPGGEVLDHASPLLRRVRDDLRQKRQRRRATLAQCVRGTDTSR